MSGLVIIKKNKAERADEVVIKTLTVLVYLKIEIIIKVKYTTTVKYRNTSTDQFEQRCKRKQM